VIDAAQPTYTWHTDIDINGQPYPTRHPVPDHGPNSDDYHGDLPDEQRDYMRAIHEAGHATATLAACFLLDPLIGKTANAIDATPTDHPPAA